MLQYKEGWSSKSGSTSSIHVNQPIKTLKKQYKIEEVTGVAASLAVGISAAKSLSRASWPAVELLSPAFAMSVPYTSTL
jgi:hypothetical protein